MASRKHPGIVKWLYLCAFLFFAGLTYYGYDFYFSSRVAKARHVLRPVLRQSGKLGHFLGILGSLMMIFLLLYSVRKRFKFAKRWGKLNSWLEIHIFLGIAGPLLVLYHTAFKFNGIVAVSFWSMVLVVVSGILGKYIYELIPRSISGMELSRIELEAEEIYFTFQLRKIIPRNHNLWKYLKRIESGNNRSGNKFSNIIFFVFFPLQIRMNINRELGRYKSIDKKVKKKIRKIIIEKQKLLKKSQLLERSLSLLKFWHLIHKPFVIIMFLILTVHVYIALKMGYKWIF